MKKINAELRNAMEEVFAECGLTLKACEANEEEKVLRVKLDLQGSFLTECAWTALSTDDELWGVFREVAGEGSPLEVALATSMLSEKTTEVLSARLDATKLEMLRKANELMSYFPGDDGTFTFLGFALGAEFEPSREVVYKVFTSVFASFAEFNEALEFGIVEEDGGLGFEYPDDDAEEEYNQGHSVMFEDEDED